MPINKNCAQRTKTKMSTVPSSHKKKKKRKIRWDRIVTVSLLFICSIWLIVRTTSKGGNETESQAPVDALLKEVVPEEPAKSEDIDVMVVEDASEQNQATQETMESSREPENTAIEETKAANRDLASIFAPGYNPYENHLPSMPDDGCIKMKINPIGGTLGKVFNDINPLHLEAARAIGIKPITNLSSAWHLRRPIVEVKSCREYYIHDLSHSYPYLVPEAATLLSDIGRAFNDSLQARGGGSYRIKVTSLLRTPRTVAKLRRVNRNATEESAHQYATTFDISYGKFICDSLTVNRTQEDLKNLLAEVLNDMRQQGRCYIKHERKQGCFHITARK